MTGPAAPRSMPTRLGWTLLGTVFPGTALIRFGRFRSGIALYLLGFAPKLLVLLVFSSLRSFDFPVWLTVVGAALALFFGVSVTSLLLTWRASHWKSPIVAPAQRWYAILGLIVLAVLALGLSPDIRSYTRNFSVPSASMRPTLEVGDFVAARMQHIGSPQRAGVIVYRHGAEERIGRVVALAGEVVELRGGVPVIDGHAARQQPSDDRSARPSLTHFLTEQLPGEQGTHRIADTGTTTGDDFGPVRVLPGHLFILGDNRDNSADSRFPPEQYGVGMIPVGEVIGVPEFIYWSADRDRIGQRLNEGVPQ